MRSYTRGNHIYTVVLRQYSWQYVESYVERRTTQIRGHRYDEVVSRFIPAFLGILAAVEQTMDSIREAANGKRPPTTPQKLARKQSLAFPSYYLVRHHYFQFVFIGNLS